MNRAVSFDAAPITERSGDLPVAPPALTAVLVAVACTVAVLHAGMTPEQRIALLAQAGMFP